MLQAKRPIPVTIDIPSLRNSNFDPWDFFSNTNRYSIMDNFSKSILKNQKIPQYLPPISLSRMTLTPPTSDKEILEKFFVPGGIFLSKIEICRLASFLTDEGKDFLRKDGNMTILGYFDRENVITVYWCTVLRQWVFNCLPAREWLQEVDLLLKKPNFLDN